MSRGPGAGTGSLPDHRIARIARLPLHPRRNRLKCVGVRPRRSMRRLRAGPLRRRGAGGKVDVEDWQVVALTREAMAARSSSGRWPRRSQSTVPLPTPRIRRSPILGVVAGGNPPRPGSCVGSGRQQPDLELLLPLSPLVCRRHRSFDRGVSGGRGVAVSIAGIYTCNSAETPDAPPGGCGTASGWNAHLDHSGGICLGGALVGRGRPRAVAFIPVGPRTVPPARQSGSPTGTAKQWRRSWCMEAPAATRDR